MFPTLETSETSTVDSKSKYLASNLRRLESLARLKPSAQPKSKQELTKRRPKVKFFERQRNDTRPVYCGEQDKKLWVEKFCPKSLADHFVHKSKIAQFQNWLTGAKKGDICLLTGGSGVGKTATVHLVAAELEYQIKEWVNPVSLTQFQLEGLGYRDEEVVGRTLIDEFEEFLHRSSQYPSLPIKGHKHISKTLVLLEDFPSFFYMDVNLLHQMIRNYRIIGDNPLVIVMTDTGSVELAPYKLFPRTILLEFGIQEIRFNPVASSLLTKFVNSILPQVGTEISTDIISEIIAASGGDVRSTVNNLQFRLLKTTVSDRRTFKKRKLPSVPNGSAIFPKDETLLLFHALGKVLYCKRDTSIISEIESKVPNIDDQRLHPLKDVPEVIGEKIGVNPETFVDFLAHNYVNFFGSINEIASATTLLADSSSCFSCWKLDDLGSGGKKFKSWGTHSELGLNLAIRGLMYFNKCPNGGSTWKPIQKPKLMDTMLYQNSMIRDTRTYFPGPGLHHYTDLIPYTAIIRPSSISPEEKHFFEEYGKFRHIKSGSELLDEMDAIGYGEEGLHDVVVTTSRVPKNDFDANVLESEEIFTIEDVPE